MTEPHLVPAAEELEPAGRRPNLLRVLSEQEVLEAIFRDGPVTRPQIAERTGLSKATVGAVVERLEQARLVRTSGPQHGRRGRSPLAYEVRETAGFVLGLAIGADHVQAVAADIFGAPVAHAEQPTARAGAGGVSAQAIDLAGRVAEQAGASHDRLLAVGVSAPGVVDPGGRVTALAYTVSPDGGLDPLAALRTRLDAPVRLENDVNLAAIAESWRGVAHGVSNFAFVWVGAGVGMGLVLGGELVRGAHGAAGEIGYLPSSHDPFDERHRLHGGLEDEIGAAGLLAALAARRGATRPVPASAADVLALAANGDADARAVVEHLASRIGTAIASVIAVIDPELIVLGGEVGSDPSLLGPVRAAVAALVPLPTRIESSLLGEAAPLHGATALALRDARARLFAPTGR